MVGQLHPPLVVEHQDAGAHALQDQCIERFETNHFTGPLLGKGFADFQASGQALHQQCRRKTQRAERADLQVIVRAGRVG